MRRLGAKVLHPKSSGAVTVAARLAFGMQVVSRPSASYHSLSMTSATACPATLRMFGRSIRALEPRISHDPINFLPGIFTRFRTRLLIRCLACVVLAWSGAVPAATAAVTRVVDTAADAQASGRLTLREAVAASADGDTIEFASALFTSATPTTIKLTSPLVLTKRLTIVGPGDAASTPVPRLRIEGSGAERVLHVRAPAVVVIAGLTLQGGVASGHQGGGAVLVESGANATFQACDFINNRTSNSNSGGAILNFGTLTLDQCLVSGNQAQHGGGVSSQGPFQVVRSLIEGNTATGLGGGLHASGSGLQAESSTLAANRAGTGGAIALVASGGSNKVATLTALTVVDNRADAQSGGLYVEGSAAVANVGGSLFARNLIVTKSGSQTPHDLGTTKSGKINSANYNLILKPGTTLSPWGANDQIGADPKLGPLAANGGRTRTYALLAGSPALDRGNPAFSGSLALTDQRLFPRVAPAGGRADVGAFESGPAFLLSLVGPASVSLGLGSAFVDPGVTVNGPAAVVVTRSVNGVPNGQVNPCCPGSYLIAYTATHAGVSSTVTRTVVVTEAVSLVAPASVTRFINLNSGNASVDLATIVSVTGLPATGGCTLKYSVAITPGIFNETGLAALPILTVGQIGDYTVTVKAFAPCNTEVAAISFQLRIDPGNVVWPLAIALDHRFLPAGSRLIASYQQSLLRPGESRWYKFKGTPGSRIDVTLTQLPANFDVVVYGDIDETYNELLGLIRPASSVEDKTLALLGAEFAPEAYSPEAYSPEAYSPEAYAPEAYSPEAYSPAAYSPEAYSPEAYSPEAYSPEAYSPEAYAPEAYSPEAYSPEAYSPEAYATAQLRSLIAFSASAGTVSEGVRFNTYSRTGEFYVRVRGQNGVCAPNGLFTLTVAIQQDLCAGVTDFNVTPTTAVTTVPGDPTSLMIWDSARIAGTPAEKTALTASLTSFAAAANALVVDVNSDARIRALNTQADSHPACPVAKNLVADAIRNLIRAYRQAAPTLADITLVGNDDVIPFFRTRDEALLASEANYFPPVQDATQSQSALRYAQVLTQDRYGSACQVVLSTGPYDLPEVPTGRVVETATEVALYLNKYRALFDGTVATGGLLPTPSSAFVAGYDFLADAAMAMRDDFAAGLGNPAAVTSLITPADQPPALGWTADQLRAAFLGRRYDISYLAAHFSTGRALAADYTTRFRAQEVAASAVDLAYALIFSAGCHSGYSTVDPHALPLLTDQPDWAQAFARKHALWISGTGYQYGDTDFVEYTERLLLEVSRALRTGPGPIPVGRALVDAKRRYLADTPLMRGIHEKTLLQVVLYGLPMVKMNLPAPRLSPPIPGADIPAVTPVPSGPGLVHGLRTGALAFSPALTRVDRTLDVVGSTATVVASYFRGSDGVVAVPGEPVRPLESFNVTRPEGLVRGIGFRGGNYTDLAGFIPFTGAPATETRGVHGQFSTEVFYPVRPWNLNQMGVVCDGDGIADLNTFPAQFRSDGIDTLTGTLRRYDQMQFTVFYCPSVTEAALANPPAFNVVASTVSPTAVSFAIETAATAGAGVQEVWITYTGLPGSPHYGKWQSLTLAAPAGIPTGIGTWTGTLPLNGADASLIRFIVQAANGIGAVAANTNFGRFFTPGTSTLDSVGTLGSPTTVTLVAPVPTSGNYRATLPLSARLTTGGAALAGKRIRFRIGPAIQSAVTDATGLASTSLLLNTQPGAYTLEATFAGDATYQNASASGTFTVTKMPTALNFASTPVVPNADGILVALKAQDGTPLKERTVVFLLDNGSSRSAVAEITDGAGQARLPSGGVPPGAYQVSAYFAVPVTLPDGTVASLIDPLYLGAMASRAVTISPPLTFSSEKVWVNYTDPTAAGATAGNAGVSKIEAFAVIAAGSPTFGPSSILSSPTAPTVTTRLKVSLSGQVLADGLVSLAVQAGDNAHWQGTATLNGAAIELFVDWNSTGGTGQYRLLFSPPPGSGPLYNALPALLRIELLLGVGAGEQTAGSASEIGGASKPWSIESGSSRLRFN